MIPAAITATFVENKAGNLEWKADEKDDRDDNESGYISSGKGDSGAPYWTYDNLIENHFRGTIVAIHSTGSGTVFLTNEYKICRETATKITDEILQWIKVKSGI